MSYSYIDNLPRTNSTQRRATSAGSIALTEPWNASLRPAGALESFEQQELFRTPPIHQRGYAPYPTPPEILMPAPSPPPFNGQPLPHFDQGRLRGPQASSDTDWLTKQLETIQRTNHLLIAVVSLLGLIFVLLLALVVRRQ